MTTITITIDALYGIDTDTFFPGSQPTVNVASTQNANAATLDFRLNTGDQSDLFHTYRLAAVGNSFSIDTRTKDVSGTVRAFTMTDLPYDSFPSQLMHMQIDLTDGWATYGGITVPSFAGLTAGSLLNMIGQSGPANLVLIGGIGNDTLRGTFYGDTLQGGEGADRLLGGGGNDTASYASSEAGVSVNLATKVVSGGDAAGDTLDSIENVRGSDSVDVLTGDDGDNGLEGLGGADTIRGGKGNDSIFGGAGNNTLYGDAGNDRIDGGLDIDTIYGGIGDDDLRGGNGAANTIYGEDGKDSLSGGNGIDKLYGGAGDDTIDAGTGAGAGGIDILDGGTGADDMYGGAGSSDFYVDNAGDRVSDGFFAPDSDRVLTSVSYTLSTFAQIEVFSTTNAAGTGAINLTGNEYVQAITGNAGANVIDGKVGADTMTGLGGNDTYYVDNAGDKVVEGANGGSDSVFASVDYTLAAGVQVEKLATTNAAGLTSIFLTGNEFAQTIQGNNTENTLDGKGGADTMQGFGGDDRYIVDNAGDVVIEVAGGGAADAVRISVSYVLTAAAQVESMYTDSLDGTTSINLTGNQFAQTLLGNAGANKLDGKGGADNMTGVDGNDTYYVDNVGDTVVENAGQGTADWVAASISYTLDAGVQIEKLSTVSSGATTAIDLTGNEFVQAITGNAGANKLNGMGGADTMSGLAGNDTYYVDNAGDKVVETAGQGTADWVATSVNYVLGAGVQVEKLSTTSSGSAQAMNLTGNEFAQTIAGNAGANRINGRAGNDTLTGGAGADSFEFNTALNSATNVDRITDFSVADDAVRLENAIFTQITGAGTLTADQFYKSTAGVAHDATDRIIYETDTGKLFYDSNGSASGGSFQFATLAANLALTSADFVVI